jgi:cytochrome c-type biogenesis protein CcmH
MGDSDARQSQTQLVYSAVHFYARSSVMPGRWIFFVILVLTASSAFAAIDVHEFESDVQRLRYQSFIDEMRCPKCQNQNLSGSDSPIAEDLRHELYAMIQDGRSDKEIVDFMVERYGEYILYRPRLSPATLMLWIGPVVLFILGVVVLIVIVRQRRRDALVKGPVALDSNEQSRLAELLRRSSSSSDNNQRSGSDNKPSDKEPRS